MRLRVGYSYTSSRIGVVNVRLEAVIQLIIAISFVASWFVTPIWAIKGINYSIYLTPLGYVVIFFGNKALVPPPTVFAVWLFALDAGLVPIIWRKTRYPLYLSMILAVLSLTMLVDTVLFQQRYLQVRGYVISPTPNGYIYVQLPHVSVFEVPFYILLALVVITVVNSVTGAKWTNVQVIIRRRKITGGNQLDVIKGVLDRVGVKYEDVDNGVRVGGTMVLLKGNSLILVKDSIETEVSPDVALAELVKAGADQLIRTAGDDYEGE